jgi:hypothetical protein
MIIEGWPEMTFSAVYWYRDSKSNCGERVCFRNLKNLDNVLKLNNFDASIRLKCHECYQFAFIGVLKQLVARKYKKIIKLLNEISREQEKNKKKYYEDLAKGIDTKGLILSNPGDNPIFLKAQSLDFQTGMHLMQFIGTAYDCIHIKLNLYNSGALKRNLRIMGSSLYSDQSQWGTSVRFNKFIQSLVGYSLAEFINSDDLKKLKLCRWCEKFFVSKKRDSRIKYCPKCSKICKMPKEEQLAYNKEWYRKSKKRITDKRREEKIKEYMELLECTREEAIDTIEFDSLF